MLFTLYVCTSHSALFAVLKHMALRSLLKRTLQSSYARFCILQDGHEVKIGLPQEVRETLIPNMDLDIT